MKITIIDYGMGNLHSIKSALNFLGETDVIVSDNEKIILKSDKLILPGVGSFKKAMETLNEKKLNASICEAVLEKKIHILGICLGMQLLSLSSTEEGLNKGLGLINGNVKKFNLKNKKIPHVGFNQVTNSNNSILFKNLNNNSDFYFTHSYFLDTNYDINQSFTNYGIDFISSFEYENIFGVQFHPELSHSNGIMLLKNFLDF